MTESKIPEEQDDSRPPAGDIFLRLFVDLINSIDFEISMIVSVPGATIAGQAISNAKYFRETFELLRNAGPGGVGLAEGLSAVIKPDEIEAKNKGEEPRPEPKYLHLRNANYFGQRTEGTPLLVRIQLDQISAFSFGRKRQD